MGMHGKSLKIKISWVALAWTSLHNDHVIGIVLRMAKLDQGLDTILSNYLMPTIASGALNFTPTTHHTK